MAKSTKSPKQKAASKQEDPTSHASEEAKALKVPEYKPFSFDAPIPKAKESLTVAAGARPDVETIVYIHGINNKPLASVLKCQWDSALFGVQLGDRSRMAYWVNREYYPTPLNETCAAGDTVTSESAGLSTNTIVALMAGKPMGEEATINAEIESLTTDPAQQAWLRSLAEKMTSTPQPELGTTNAADVSAKIIPLPKVLRDLITQQLTSIFMRDVHDFFFSPLKQKAMEQSLLDRLKAGGGPFVVIAHSQGTMIAYNVLRQLSKAECDVQLFVTIGSPLGLTEVQDMFKRWIPDGVLHVPECVTRWVNVADRLDPVAADSDISDEFTPHGFIENTAAFFLNPDSPLHPHSATGYLVTDAVRDVVYATVGNAFPQAVAKTLIAKDLVEDLENGLHPERHMTLIQLVANKTVGSADQMPLAKIRTQLTQAITQMVISGGDELKNAEIEPLKRFVAAKLTRLEVEQLRTRFKDLQIERVWRNASKKALIHQSTNTVQASPANNSYAALGKGIGWAVLDTGIQAGHPHFKEYKNVISQWDCTKTGDPEQVAETVSAQLDGHGHGTHVAGIIAGHYLVPFEKGETKTVFAGMAPQASLYGFKVLDDRGNGRDSWIIKALDLIADLNEGAGKLVIHGVNLSLGGRFDPSVYGCGHTPLCQELRRLWQQGVLVCLAAGNEGYAVLQAASGEVPANMDLSIGDPANLEEAIAIGSIHKSNPHTYGVSYFSSRGPTADGRRKPDLVAPGEQILSAYHAFKKRDKEDKEWLVRDLYIEMSGTSMATPHVSGVLAAFLSMRREFCGYPDRVKSLLLENCTDLRRDPYIQGFGMPNLIKMLTNT